MAYFGLAGSKSASAPYSLTTHSCTRRVSDPALVRTLLLTPNIPVVVIDDPGWLIDFTECLAGHGTVQLQAVRSEERKLRVGNH